MFEKLTIKSVFRDYHVDFITDFAGCLKYLRREGDYFFTDAKILELYPVIRQVAGDNLWEVNASEEAKSYEGVIPLIQRLVMGGFRKNHRVIAIGGGITQDIAAFVASMLYRGVDWYFFPTNVLTQCDSCIGSKTSINFRNYKNQLGGFYPPTGIFIDTNFIKSLGEREIASGLGEMLHYFLLTSEDDLRLFMHYAPQLRNGGQGLDVLMHRSLAIKKAMIEIDEFDKGPRNIFNYGHSFGHALESALRYIVPHGIAVSYGIDLANFVSANLGLLPMGERNRFRNACEVVFKGCNLPDVDMECYFSALQKDKKNVDNKLGLILTRGIGDMFKEVINIDDIKEIIVKFYDDKIYLYDV